MKKAQANTVFGFVFAVIVIAVIGAVGAWLLHKVMSPAPLVSDAKFKEGLSDAFRDIAYGSSKEITLRAPSGSTRVCFFDNSSVAGKQDNMAAFSPILQDYVQQGKNVLILRKQQIIDALSEGRIRTVDKVVKCFDTSKGVLSFIAQGGEYGTIIIGEE